MKKIALVNQRYGLQVNGGSELYTRQLAEHLTDRYEVDVLTTKALDYDTWRDYYSEDVEQINGVTVRRFHARKKNKPGMKIWGRVQKYCPFFRLYSGERWINAQGPYSPELIRYIRDHRSEYYIILFVTYLYYPAVKGIRAAGDKAVLVPTAHDEPYIYFPVFQRTFSSPGALLYLTPEEKSFVESVFPVSQKPNCVCGAGVDIPQTFDETAFRKKYGVKGDYIIYAGRIDQGKGCDEMFHIFRKYREKNPERPVKLVLLGKAMMDIPDNTDILSLGYVPDQDKFDGISGAKALWLPSRYESLSLAVLEAMSLGTPVLVNGLCEVLKGHCERSGGGLYYLDQMQAMEALNSLLIGANCDRMSQNARKYIEENYQWDKVIDRIEGILSHAVGL